MWEVTRSLPGRDLPHSHTYRGRREEKTNSSNINNLCNTINTNSSNINNQCNTNTNNSSSNNNK